MTDKNGKRSTYLPVIIIILISCVLCVSYIIEKENTPIAINISADKTIVYFFYSEDCSHCHEVMPFINSTIKKYAHIKFEIIEVGHNITNQNIAISMNQHMNNTEYAVPEVIVGSTILIGSKEISENLESILDAVNK